MTRALSSLLLLPLLAVAACTDRMPVMGFFTPPDGSLVLQGNGFIFIKLILGFDGPPLTFRVRFNDMEGVVTNAPPQSTGEKVYNYLEFPRLQQWTAGVSAFQEIPLGTYVVELVDDTGRSWGKSDPLPVHLPPAGSGPYPEVATVLFVHFDAQAGTWTVDPTTQDADPMTSEITVTNLTDGDVAVDRCVGPRTGRTCTPVGTVAPGADLHTVQTNTPPPTTMPVDPSAADASALVIHAAARATPFYERSLVYANGIFNACEVERIIVHGARELTDDKGVVLGKTAFATSSCDSN
jgi:hypothetical protein